MRSRSSKQGNKGGLMEIEKLNKLKEEPHLSGAYIRSLVKQLTSSRTKEPINPKTLDSIDGDVLLPQNLTKFSETQQTHQPQQPQQPKKQVRRRLHTSRPYQERLLNMAEARREIVTALKFHRAAMKQANEQQQSLQSPPPPSPSLEQEDRMKEAMRNPRIYPSNTSTTTTTSNYLENLSYSSFSCPPPPLPNPFPWASSSIAPLTITENLNFTLPNQPLGLNLNFHEFNNLDTTLYHNFNNNNNNPSIYSYSYSSPSSSSSPTLSSIDESHSVIISPEEPTPMVMDSGITNGGLHPVMDEEEIAEIRSMGDQHQMEWNDTLNFVTSAWWFKFMKTMEIGPEMKEEKKGEDDDGFHLFDEVMEFPSWMSANESCFLQHHFADHSSEDNLQELSLPCMDIGEIEGMDGEWLA